MLQPRHMSREELIQTAIDQATDNPLAYHLALILETSLSPEEVEELEGEADALEEEIRSLETNNLRIEQEAESLSNELEDARAEIRHLERQCVDLERDPANL